MIGTPTYDGRLDVRYVDALINTIRTSPVDTYVFPVFVPGDALVQRARNYLFSLAMRAQVDDLVMIDSDMGWAPADFWRLMAHDVHFVGALCRQKIDEVVLTIYAHENAIPQESGLLEVDGVGGMVRLTSFALNKLWNMSSPYKNGLEVSRMVYEVTIDDKGELVGEDLAVCNKWRSLKEHVYVDTTICCDHVGLKVFSIPKVSKNKEQVDEDHTR